METIKPNSYLFCEEFAALGGIFLGLSSTAFLGCFWVPSLNLCRFPGFEFPEETVPLVIGKFYFQEHPFHQNRMGVKSTRGCGLESGQTELPKPCNWSSWMQLRERERAREHKFVQMMRDRKSWSRLYGQLVCLLATTHGLSPHFP